MNNKILIIGAGGHGRVVADIVIRTGIYTHIAFIDDNPSLKRSMGIDVIDNLSGVYRYIGECDFAVAVGDNMTRMTIQEALEAKNASLPVLIHPSAVVGQCVTISSGTVVMAGAVINCESVIHKGCIINTSASIDHDSVIKEYVHISPGVHLGGTVSIGEKTWIGLGAYVKNNVNICGECIIGVGTVVVKDINEPGTYLGVPARKVL